MKTYNSFSLWPASQFPVSELRRDFDRLFDDWISPTLTSKNPDQHFAPPCEVEEAEDHYLLALEVPGVKKDDIKIEFLGDNQLLISGERRAETTRNSSGDANSSTQGEYQTYSERKFGKFQRSFTLPVGIDAEKVEAHYQDGILRVVIPKAEVSKPRQIKISSGGVPEGSRFLGRLIGRGTGERVA